jgi:hypothetical protein
MMRRPTLAAVAVAISIVLLSADAFAGVVATPVRINPTRREFEASGNADYFAWIEDRPTRMPNSTYGCCRRAGRHTR